ncbi:hypothetical protein FRC12_007474 [Ceratobasidium sp. 428]|nr:hypothetical protein FRC12_007474 [Ceratobasidium sp. 428]
MPLLPMFQPSQYPAALRARSFISPIVVRDIGILVFAIVYGPRMAAYLAYIIRVIVCKYNDYAYHGYYYKCLS